MISREIEVKVMLTSLCKQTLNTIKLLFEYPTQKCSEKCSPVNNGATADMSVLQRSGVEQ